MRTETIPAAALDGRGPHLLIVEDDHDNRELLRELMVRDGFRATAVADGQSALNVLADSAFDGMLLDIDMPGADGFEVLRAVRQNHTPSQLPVIMITGMAERRHVVEALGLGANDYVTKPFDAGIVSARLQMQLSLKQAYDHIYQLEQDLERKNAALQQANGQLERAYQHIKADLHSAARVQQALLPTSLPEVPGLNVNWYYRPCDELAGDSLNVFQLDRETVGTYLLDVSGHGVRAALLSVAVARALQPVPGRPSLVCQPDPGGQLVPTSPAQVAEELNRRFQLEDDAAQFFTLLYGTYNTRTKFFEYVCAGHPAPLYLPAGEAPRQLNHRGMAIGLIPDPSYEIGRVRLRQGDRLYVYSDGLDEVGVKRDRYGVQRIMGSLHNARDTKLSDSLATVVAAAEAWAGAGFEDDVSAFALECTG